MPSAIDSAALLLSGEVVNVAVVMEPAESVILRPEYTPTLKREKSVGRSTCSRVAFVMVPVISGEMVTCQTRPNFSLTSVR